jgi:NADPH-dependent 2,4-dienoyl-CoA reductase/sulfur reductase-like enzyme
LIDVTDGAPLVGDGRTFEQSRNGNMTAGLVVIGAQTAGLAAATQARRMNPALPVTLVDRDAWPATATCGLPWLVAAGPDASLVLHSPEELARKYRFTMLLEHEATGIQLARREVICRRPDGRTVSVPFTRLVIATGARPYVPTEIQAGPRDRIFTLRGVAEARALQIFLATQRPRRAAILGAGPLGLEMADLFRRQGLTVILLERTDQVLPGLVPSLAGFLQQSLMDRGMECRLRTTVREVQPSGSGIALGLCDGTELSADLLFCAVGIRPNTEIFQELPFRFEAGGHLSVNLRMETALDSIYAAGDCAAAPHRLHGRPAAGNSAVAAALAGRVAGENAAGRHAESSGVLGAWSLEVLEHEVAAVGLNPAEASAAGWPAVGVEIEVPARPVYMPGPGPMRLAGCVRADTRTLVGCQVVGGPGAAAALQPLPLLLGHPLTLEEILSLEFPYTPPLGPLWHPLQQLAAVARKTIS